MNKVLLDTDIYSEIIKAVNPVVTQNAEIYYNYVGYYTIGLADCMLAATAICHNLVLVTGNTKHYQRSKILVIRSS